MVNLTRFITEHKILCLLSCGTAIIGYLGYRTVKWLLQKSGITAKTDEVARGKIHTHTPLKNQASPISLRPVQKDTIPQIQLSLSKKIDIEINVPPIISKRQNVTDFIHENFQKKTDHNEKYSRRLKSIASAFGKEWIYAVRGDGNCFCNAAVAGIVNHLNTHPERRLPFLKIVEDHRSKSDAYVSPDKTADAENNIPEHNVNFSKEKDFDTVINGLKDPIDFSDKLLSNFDFSAGFSRIIRYILFCHRKELGLDEREIPLACGKEIDMGAIPLFNQIFNLNAGLAVFQGKPPFDLPKADEFLAVKGQDPVPIQINHGEKNDADFLILSKTGHFFAMA